MYAYILISLYGFHHVIKIKPNKKQVVRNQCALQNQWQQYVGLVDMCTRVPKTLNIFRTVGSSFTFPLHTNFFSLIYSFDRFCSHEHTFNTATAYDRYILFGKKIYAYIATDNSSLLIFHQWLFHNFHVFSYVSLKLVNLSYMHHYPYVTTILLFHVLSFLIPIMDIINIKCKR